MGLGDWHSVKMSSVWFITGRYLVKILAGDMLGWECQWFSGINSEVGQKSHMQEWMQCFSLPW